MSLRLLSVVALVVLAVSASGAANLIQNGDFETGTLAHWSEFDEDGGSGSWFPLNTFVGPISGMSTVGPAGGAWYAMTDQGGPGSHVLLQSFTVSGDATLAFDMFVNNYAGVIAGCGGLDFNVFPTECGRVDILTADANPFDTGAGVVQNLYSGSDAGANPNPYTHYSFALSLAPGTYQLRFAEADNQLFFNMGIDNVEITSGTAAPEPGTLVFFGTGIIGVAAAIRRKMLL